MPQFKVTVEREADGFKVDTIVQASSAARAKVVAIEGFGGGVKVSGKVEKIAEAESHDDETTYTEEELQAAVESRLAEAETTRQAEIDAEVKRQVDERLAAAEKEREDAAAADAAKTPKAPAGK